MSLNPAPTSLNVPLKNERLFMLVLAGIQFTHILDFMIMMPLGPQMLRALHMNTREFGLLLSSYTFAAAISGLLAATCVDRFDRRTLALTLYALFTAATLCCALAPDFTALLAARALAGAFGGVLGALVQTMVADVIPFERRGRAMGILMAAFSLSTVAGVPLGLVLANHVPALGWRAPFVFIVLLCCGFLVLGFRLLPNLTAHLRHNDADGVLHRMHAVAREPGHPTAFLFVALLMLGGFTVIPYLALYYTTNVGMPESFITLIYLCGGAATFVTARLIGRLSDRHGKLRIFRWLALAAILPMLVTTHLGPVAWWWALANATLFFILVSGRIIPGMAMVTAVAPPHMRGSFMSLSSSVQMMASGLASLVAGLIIARDATGRIEHFNVVGYIAVGCGLASVWVAQRMRVATPPVETPATEAGEAPA